MFLGKRMLMRKRVCTVLAVITAAAGCSDAGGEDRNTVEVVDSAGIELVRNQYRDFDTLAVTMVEDLRIGTLDGDEKYQFFRIGGINVDAMGRILVANHGTSTIRVYDSQGRYVREIGKKGDGPGEFRSVTTPIVWRDTIAVSDQEAMRFSLFDTAGTFLTSWPMLTAERRALFPVGASEAGWAVWIMPFGVAGPERRPGEVTMDTTRVGRMDAPSLISAAQRGAAFVDSVVHSVLFWESAPVTWMQGDEGVVGFTPLFAQNRWWAVGGTGKFYLSAGPGYQIDIFGLDGRLERRISRDFEVIPVTDALVDEYLDRLQEATLTLPPSAFDRVGSARRRAGATRSAYLPPTRRIFVSNAGELWVERLDVQRDISNWESIPGVTPPHYYYDVFAADGRYEFTVKPPERFVPRWIGKDVVLGIQRDEQDVEYVARYRLVSDSPR
jgi:hypothetical protein